MERLRSAGPFSQSAGEQLARLLSDLANALFVALPTFLVIAFASAPDTFVVGYHGDRDFSGAFFLYTTRCAPGTIERSSCQ